jgi:hypothetical protein
MRKIATTFFFAAHWLMVTLQQNVCLIAPVNASPPPSLTAAIHIHYRRELLPMAAAACRPG